MKSIATLLILLSFNTFAARENFELFLDSLEDHVLMRTDHLIDITPKIRLSKMGIFDSRNAEATYSPLTNTIKLKEENLVSLGRGYRIKSFSEYATTAGYNPFIVKAQTIFHELAHADFDVYLEGAKHLEIHHYLTQKIPAWFKKNFRGVNAKTATHELFGYTAGNFIFTINSKMLDTLINHGLYHNQDKCFGEVALRKIATRLELDKKIEFKDTLQIASLENQIIPGFIFINGKSLDIKALPQEFKTALMTYFKEQYSLASNTKELAHKLNSSAYLNRLQNCYKFLNAN